MWYIIILLALFQNVVIVVIIEELIVAVLNNIFESGPRPNTIDDFWRMIWQQNVNLIIMVTSLIENGKVCKRRALLALAPEELL